MKARFVSFVVSLIALFSFGNAYADSPHFVKGPTTSISGTRVNVSGKIAGLGGGETYFISITDGTATGTVDCRNGGGQIVASQSHASIGVNIQPTPLTVPKNGQLSFSLNAQATIIGNPCPNRNWNPELRSLDSGSFSGTLTIRNSAGEIVLTQSL